MKSMNPLECTHISGGMSEANPAVAAASGPTPTPPTLPKQPRPIEDLLLPFDASIDP